MRHGQPDAGFAASSLSARHERTVAAFMLALFYLTHNVGTVFFQARKVPPDQNGAAVAAYFAGIVAGALLMAVLERRDTWRSPDKDGRLLRAFFLGLLLFPSIFSEISMRVTGYPGTAFLNFFQPMLWAAQLPVAVLFFFRHVPAERQALFFCAAISAGHLCWALIAPLAASADPGGAALAGTVSAAALENRFLPLLSLTRNLLGAAFSLLCWLLAQADAHPTRGPQARPGQARGTFPARGFALLLPAFLACSLFNGFTGYLFFPRLAGGGQYPEYLHMAVAMLFPLACLYLDRRGDTALLRLTGIAVLSFVLFPLLLFLPASAWAGWAVYPICTAAQLLLTYCGALAFARFAPFSRLPSLVVSATWLTMAVAVPGRLLALVLPSKGLPVFPVGCLLAALCAASLVPLRRAFPLPEPPDTGAESDSPDAAPNTAEAARLELLRLEAEAKLRAFAAAFDLSTREAEVLDGILRSLDNEALAAKMTISVRGVRYHLGGLLQKTGSANRRRLVHFYTSWHN